MTVEEQLRPRWNNLWAELGLTGDSELEFLIVLSYYHGDHRHYHNLEHILHGLDILGTVRGFLAYYSTEDITPLVELAWWFHDSVYDTHRHDNEIMSAELAYNFCVRAGLTAPEASRVYDLVIQTTHRASPCDTESSLIQDIDLAILGEPAKVFDTYEVSIREEYSWVDSGIYVEERINILRGFLQRNQIYHLPYFYRSCEAAARENLTRSITRLRREV